MQESYFNRFVFVAMQVSAWLCCMNLHDPKRIVYAPARQYWRAFVCVMQVRENHCIKRAGVAGLRARAICNGDNLQRYMQDEVLKDLKEDVQCLSF